MHTFYYPDHARHDPEQLHQPDTPQRYGYYCEVARRGEVIIESLQKANLGPITEPGDFSIEPIGEIHEYGLLNLLQNAYERMAQEEQGALSVPDTFRIHQNLSHKPRSIWGQLGYYAFDTSSPIFEHTWEVTYWNAQVAVSAAALVNVGSSSVAYALCRPPGHHAGPNFYGGFCYLNNAAIAAHWLVQQGQRVAILDLDYHHGNGTQAIFYGRSDVLTLSIHADPLTDYPYFWGYADEIGVESGKGFNFNYPLPRGAGESEYLAAFGKALEQVRSYVPDVLMISLGLDIIEDDPMGAFHIKTPTLTNMGQAIAAHSLPTIVVQEGGYNLATLGENVVAFLTGLVNHPSAPDTSEEE